MDHAKDARVALLSIKPEFAAAIFAGTKKVEFRRVRFREQPTHVIVYASGPMSRVLGYFTVRAMHNGSPRSLWERFKRVAGISRTAFFEYFAGSHVAVALEIGQLSRLTEPTTLAAAGLGSRPPQSFSYVNSSVLAKLGRTET